MATMVVSYCQGSQANPLLKHHHDTEHGVHTSNERELFEYFCLEINQAGLSWAGILGKRASMRQAWLQFDPDRIAKLSLEASCFST